MVTEHKDTLERQLHLFKNFVSFRYELPATKEKKAFAVCLGRVPETCS